MRVGHEGLAQAPASPDADAGAKLAGRGQAVWSGIRRRLTAEHGLVLLLGLLVLAVHDVGYLLGLSFWNDEAWVAVTTRFPLSMLPSTTSSTPVGWTFLMRWITVHQEQTGRLLALAFCGAAVVAGYWLARRLDWPSRAASLAAGLAAGLGVLLVPAMLVRDDLKQYTADAFMALLALAVISRLERQWSRLGLAALSVTIWGGMLLSHAVAFVGVAIFLALGTVQVARRNWRRLIEVALTGAFTVALMLAVYETFDARAVRPRLTNSPMWVPFYLPRKGLHAMVSFVTNRFGDMHAYFGLGPAWLAIPLVIAGLITITRLGRPATALAVVVLWPEMLAASALHKYPFLDLRTSTFLFAITVVVAAVGLVGIGVLVRSRLAAVSAAWRPALGMATAAVVLAGAAGFAFGAWPYVRSHNIPNEKLRRQVLYVAAHASPSDVILVNMNSNWGFAYYWPTGEPALRPTPALLQGREAYFPGQPRIVIARNRDLAGVEAVLAQALGRARQHSCVRVWLIRAHVVASERTAWQVTLRQRGLSPVPVGHSGLSYIRAGMTCGPAAPKAAGG
jgi:hypothetical protein